MFWLSNLLPKRKQPFVYWTLKHSPSLYIHGQTLPLLSVWLDLLHGDVWVEDPQQNPYLSDEHPLLPLSQLADVNIQNDLHKVIFPRI